MSKLRNYVLSLLPEELRQFLRRKISSRPSFDDSFEDWTTASQASSGYGTEAIVAKVLESTLAVQKGEAVFERDSVAFERADYSWPVLSAILWAAAVNNGVLRVLDFGGSLGSTFFQYSPFLKKIPEVEWSIVEQDSFVEAGNTSLNESKLTFHLNIEDCIRLKNPNFIFFGSSLQYVEDPMSLLQSVANSKAEILLIDRTPATELDHDLYTVQKVPDWIYPASYPARVFSKARLTIALQEHWEVVAEYDWPGGGARTTSGVAVGWCGWLCVRKDKQNE